MLSKVGTLRSKLPKKNKWKWKSELNRIQHTVTSLTAISHNFTLLSLEFSIAMRILLIENDVSDNLLSLRVQLYFNHPFFPFLS